MLVIVSLMVVFPLLYGESFHYVGVQRCKICHSGEMHGMVYEKWLKSKHAVALDTLSAKGEDKNPKCLVCHVTGFNVGGYKIGAANAADFAGVQCESCHGPGSGYARMSIMPNKKLAMENGLIMPNEALCRKCHNENSPTFKGFNFKEYEAKIYH